MSGSIGRVDERSLGWEPDQLRGVIWLPAKSNLENAVVDYVRLVDPVRQGVGRALNQALPIQRNGEQKKFEELLTKLK